MKSRFRHQFALLFLVVILSNHPGTACAQGSNGTLSGRLTDRTTNAPIPQANIRILDLGTGTTSDSDGYFQVRNIPPGIYRVQFSIVGYRTIVVRGISILPDRMRRLDIELEPAAIELQPVEVQARRPVIERDQPSTVFSLGTDKLSRLPISSFQEALLFQPGTTLEGNVRGGKAQEVQYMVDGLPVQDVIGGGLGMDLPRSGVSAFTFYSGGFGVEYGNALSGIVNVATRSGENNSRLDVLYEKDNWIPSRWDKQVDQLNELDVTASGPIISDKLFYMTSNNLKGSNTRWWQDFQNYFSSPVVRTLAGIAKLDYFVSPTLRLGVQGIYSFGKWRDYEFSWRYNLPGLPPQSRDAYRLAFILSNTYSPISSYTISVSRFMQRSRIGSGIPAGDSLQAYQYDLFLRYIISGNRYWGGTLDQAITTLKADYTSQYHPLHLLKTGFELNFYDINSDVFKFEPQRTYFGKPLPGEPLLNYSNGYSYFPRSGNAYIQDKIEFKRDGSALTAGVRWDFFDPRAERPIVEFIPLNPREYTENIKGFAPAKIKYQISPRLAFSAPLSLKSMFFVNVGYYFQYPLFDYLYSGISPARLQNGTKNVLTGNPDLEPERTISWELGYKLGLTEDVVGSITYFQKATKNQIDAKTLVPFDSKSAGDYGFASYVNNAEARARGLELVLSKESAGAISGSLSYTLMWAEGISSTPDQEINFAQWGFAVPAVTTPLSWDQRHTIKADIEAKLPGGIDTDIILLYNSPRPYTYYPTRDGFTPLDTSMQFVPNNARMESVLIIHAKFSKTIGFEDMPFRSVQIYADARNLLNTRNVRWMDSSGRIGGELSDPGGYYDPRRVRVGLMMSF